jgi:hypothetical protein
MSCGFFRQTKAFMSFVWDLQMADFVSGNDDARETTSVLDDGDAVNLLQTLVNNACSTDVGKSFLF